MLDTCYFQYVKADLSVSISEVCSYWQKLGYQTINPGTGKIHIWTTEGDGLLLESIEQMQEYPDSGLQLWLSGSSSMDIYVRVKESSENYGFDGLPQDESITFVRLLTQRALLLLEQGKLSGMLFDRKDALTESIHSWW